MQIPILWFETVNRKFASEISSPIMIIPQSINCWIRNSGIIDEIIIPVQLGFEEEASQGTALRKIKSLESFRKHRLLILLLHERCRW